MRANPPPGVPMTRAKMYGSACAAGAAITSASGGIVKLMGRMNSKPQKPPRGTQRLMARGTLTVGSLHSSAIELIIPRALNVYAAGNRPMKKVKPPQPLNDVS